MLDHRVGRDQGGDAGGSRTPHPRAERDSLLDPDLEPVTEAEPLPEGQ